MKYNRLNNIIGWLVFLVASYTYISTIEPTASFWDCGEFIATAFKLEVGHPPGAPFFMILARFFSLFAFGDTSVVAMMVNTLSALASAFTILFLFWSVTHLAKNIIVKKGEELTRGSEIAILGSGIVGALAYTFSDTFWFSAVEGEVYATSSLFTAVVFWAILKWENIAHEKHSNRWLVFIAFMMGLSIGVHLLNLLAIPAIVFVYYFKKYTVTKKGIFAAFMISMVLLGGIMYGIIPYVVKIASWFELLFVNSFGLPFNTGNFFYGLVLILAIVWGIHYTHKKGKVLGNTIIICVTVMLIGYSSFTMIVIRSLANPPMDENNPENVFSLLSYLNREQYGDRPLVYGQYFNSPLDQDIKYKEGDPVYIQKDGKYVVADTKDSPNYDSRYQSFFPRMYSAQESHKEAYKVWSGYDDPSEEKKPSMAQNLKFFFTYQLGHMYFRYFMWNFAGRQNDIQGYGDKLRGNWVSGLSFIDDSRLGPQDELPNSLKSNKANNKYFLLPLLLGLVGLLYQYSRNVNGFVVVFLLFFFTGIAIVIYLNQTPYQPRERDYAYAASFYAFAIWIGLGVLALFRLLKKVMPETVSAGLVTAIMLILVPGIMAKENWDDHDRSHRYIARDFAKDYLESCAPNAVLITYGDNDTFPLWYAQEVEGIRTDVRVLCFTLFNTDWYVDQIARKAYDSEAVPFSMGHDQYVQGTRDMVFVMDDKRIKEAVDLKQMMEFVASDDPRTKVPTSTNEYVDFIPSKKLRLRVDSAIVVANGTVKKKDADKIVPYIDLTIGGSFLQKNELMLLDFLAINNWERPVYFTSMGDMSFSLRNYLQLEGFAYRLVPIKTQQGKQGELGRIDEDLLYDNLINKFDWGNINMPGVYLDQTIIRTTNIVRVRSNFDRLARKLISVGKKDSALVVLDRCVEVMPHESIPYDIHNLGITESYYLLGQMDKANDMARKLFEASQDELRYYFTLDVSSQNAYDYEHRVALHILQELVRLTKKYKQDDLNAEIEKVFDDVYMKFVQQENFQNS